MLIAERSRRRHPGVNLVPMIDVITFLLIFFIVFTTFRTTPAGINVNLPQAAEVDAPEQKEIVISVDQHGRMHTVAGEQSPHALRQWISEQLRRTPQAVVIVRVDRLASYESFIAAMDTARAAGASRFQLAVEPVHGRVE